MPVQYTVALVGFPPADVATLSSFFHLAARRPPAYVVQDEPRTADLLLVNADHPRAIGAVQRAALPARVMLIGRSDGGSGWPLQPRPVRLVPLLAAMDALMAASPSSLSSPPPPAPPAPAAPAPVAAAVSVPPPAPAPEPPRDFAATDVMPGRALQSRFHPQSRVMPDVPKGEGLLVAQSLVEGRILLKRFRQYGLEMDWCREPQQAQAMMASHPYRLVVIDRVQGEPDGFALCRQAKQRRPDAPMVVMFATTVGSMERMKAGLAGADGYLSRSVSEGELYRLLTRHRLVEPGGFAPTNFGEY